MEIEEKSVIKIWNTNLCPNLTSRLWKLVKLDKYISTIQNMIIALVDLFSLALISLN